MLCDQQLREPSSACRVRQKRHRAAFLCRRLDVDHRQHQEDVLQCDGIAYTLSVTLKHTIPHDKCTQTRTRCCKEPFAYAHVAGPHSHNARCQECYSLQAIGLQQFAPCRSTLISHATKCTQNWNHAMHSNAIAHAVHEDSGRDRSGSRDQRGEHGAERGRRRPPLAGVAGRASHCMCTTLCIETRTEILTGCIVPARIRVVDFRRFAQTRARGLELEPTEDDGRQPTEEECGG